MVVSHAFTRLATVVILLLGAVSLTADAQPHGKVYRIGYIQVAAPNEMEHLTKAFDEGLRETVEWYRGNEWWWRPVKTGAFQGYYEVQYRGLA